MVQLSKGNAGDHHHQSYGEFTLMDLIVPGVEITARGKCYVSLSTTSIHNSASQGGRCNSRGVRHHLYLPVKPDQTMWQTLQLMAMGNTLILLEIKHWLTCLSIVGLKESPFWKT